MHVYMNQTVDTAYYVHGTLIHSQPIHTTYISKHTLTICPTQQTYTYPTYNTLQSTLLEWRWTGERAEGSPTGSSSPASCDRITLANRGGPWLWFSFNSYSLWISRYASRSHLSPRTLSSILCPCNLPPNIKQTFKEKPKSNKKKNKIKKEKNLVLEAVVWPCGSHSLHVSPFIVTC